MKHSIYITPLNCAFDTGMNSFIKMEEDEYNSSSTRAIYCKDPLQSWFKFKSFTEGTPYLEPSIFGLNVGDIITVEFDGLLVSGDNPLNFGVSFRGINGNTVNNNPLHECTLPNNSFDTSFKHFKIPFIIMSDMDNTTGILLNIRAFAGNKHEIIIKNLKLTVETNNPNFSLSNNVVDYETKRDFIKMINHVSGTTLCSSTFKNNQALYDNGSICYQDGALHYDVVPGGKWAGIVSVLSQNSYGSPIVVYLEYKYTKGLSRIYSQSWSSSDARVGVEQYIEFPLNTTDEYVKHIMYFKGVSGEDIKYNIVNIGSANLSQNFSIKRMIVSIPRFDDENKKDFNTIEELYPNKRFNE